MMPVFSALLVTACAPPNEITPTPPQSLWGEIITVGQTEQSDAPAMLVTPTQVVTAWIGSDKDGVHQDIRLITPGGISARDVLPLPPVHPYAQEVFPALDNGLHFLWLDQDGDSQETRLFSAFVRPYGLDAPRPARVERGPIRVTDKQTLRYAAISNDDLSLWVVWSGGLLAEPSLYAQQIDAISRPRQVRMLVNDGDYPALIRANDGTVYLFWQATAGQVYRATLGDGVLKDVQAITTAPPWGQGDRLINLSAGLDADTGYVFWNLVRADGTAETWVASGGLTATWQAPTRLGIQWTSKTTFQTGFNSGIVYPAQVGSQMVSWAAPSAGQSVVLPVAAQAGTGLLVMLYLRGGQPVGYQEITPLANPMVGIPEVTTDRDRHVYLAWSQPTDVGYADLRVTSTKVLVGSG